MILRVSYRIFLTVVALWLLSGWLFVPVCSSANTILAGKVIDAKGKTVAGAMVFVYSSPDVRKTADFISPPTGKDGAFSMVVTPGKYWAVARLKMAEGFGPLMPGDRHSGEPREVELAIGQTVELEFVVVDIREAISARRKEKEGPVKVVGRILDATGTPIRNAYAVANRSEKVSGFPDYLSAWVDHEGRYTLFLPRGRYFLGSAVTFPPGDDVLMSGTITAIDADRTDLDIVRSPAAGK